MLATSPVITNHCRMPMLNLPVEKIVRRPVRVRNPGDSALVVWLEPWAERFELAPQESLDVVLIGSDMGWPEILPRVGEVAIYGWEGSDAFAFRNDQPAGYQPAVDEIIQQEFEIAAAQVVRTGTPLPVEEIASIQATLDALVTSDRESQEVIPELAGYLAWELAAVLEPSDAAADMLWQIAHRTLVTKGFALAWVDREVRVAAIWNRRPAPLRKLVRKNTLSIVPRHGIADSGSAAKVQTTPRPGAAESSRRRR
jgi:hypothetical protein